MTMSPPSIPIRPENEQRRDVHNCTVDQSAAEAGRCGTLDLKSGRMCGLPALHRGGCEFTARKNPA